MGPCAVFRQRRAETHELERAFESPLQRPGGLLRQVAGEDRGLGRAVVDRLAKYLAVRNGEMTLDGMYPALRVELGQFVAQETANGNIRYAADVGCHDDLVMSLSIALWVLIEEAGDSPQAAPIEEKPAFVFDVGKPIREARERAIAAAEEQTLRQWESISLNSGADGLFITPRGPYG